MNADTLQLVSIISFSIAGVLTLIVVYLFFKMDVRGIIDDLSGKSAERQIMAMREENNRQKNPLSRANRKTPESGKSDTSEHATVKLKSEEKTEALSKTEEKTVLLQEEGTMVLAEEATTVLDGEATTVLTDRTEQTAGKYKLTLDEMIIHTQERI